LANPFIKIREQIVNDVTAGNQVLGRVVASAFGNVLVSWGVPNNYFQVFDADGNPLSGEVTRPFGGDITFMPDGTIAAIRFVQIPGPDDEQLTIDRYSTDGTLIGSSATIEVNSVGRLVALTNGNLLLTYDIENDSTAQLFDSNLQPIGGAFTISGSNHNYVALAGGGFLDIYGSGTSHNYRVFSATGTAIGSGVVNRELPRGDALPDGGFVITSSSLALDGNNYGIAAQIFNADGTARTGEFVVNTTTAGEQSWSTVTVFDDELFMISWGPSIMYGQLFHVSGRKIGSEILLDPGGGNFPAPFGWPIDNLGDDGFVTISRVAGDVELTYWGVDRDNILIGTAAPETFDGGGAAERIMVGFAADDTYNVDSAGDEVQEVAGEGADRIRTSVSFTIAAGQEIEILQTDNNIGTAALALAGNALGQYIFGNYGANLIDGGGGGDVMLGFLGDDTYVVRDPFDQVRENAGEGFDRVNGTISYTIGAGQEVEMLTFANNIGTEALNITGNAFAQYLFGNYGNNVLTGGGGGDVMLGFLGDDTYGVGHAADDVREAAGEGNDRVAAGVSYALGAGQSIEFLDTSDAASTAAINLTGNGLAQEIIGNAGNNILTGGGGADFLRGLGGDDTYFISPDALIQELAGQGVDRLFVSGSYALAGSEIEVMTPTDEFGTDPFNLTGNTFAQYVYGNDGANQIDGGGGGDVLVGRGGDDLLFVRNAADQIREEANDGFDRVLADTNWQLNANARVEMITTTDNLGTAEINLTGNEFAQYVYGNAGDNVIGGGGGRDVLNGLGGDDRFLFDTALNTAFTANFDGLVETANVDRIDGFGVDDKIALSGTLFGLTPGAPPAGAFNTGTTATEADDRILWDAASRALLFDPDGTGAQGAQLIAFLSAPFNLDSTFIVVV
jgi:Ca2+-binding RTX toxin-like protein